MKSNYKRLDEGYLFLICKDVVSKCKVLHRQKEKFPEAVDRAIPQQLSQQEEKQHSTAWGCKITQCKGEEYLRPCSL